MHVADLFEMNGFVPRMINKIYNKVCSKSLIKTRETLFPSTHSIKVEDIIMGKLGKHIILVFSRKSKL